MGNGTASIRGFAVGSEAEFEHEITYEDIRRFVEITGDDNPLHVDRAYAERTSFRGIVVHGMLSASFISTLIGKHIPGAGALWMSQSLEFLLPVRVGDRLHVKAVVTSVQVSQSILVLQTEIRNQDGRIVLTGEGKVKVLELPDEQASEDPEPSRKTVLITGASGWIGASVALRLAADGYDVVAHYGRDKEAADSLVTQIIADGGRASAVCADLSRHGDVRDLVRTAVSKHGGISAIVHCASPRLVPKPFSSLTVEDLTRHIEVQYFGLFHLLSEALPSLLNTDNAGVVAVGSINSDGVPAPQQLHYTAAKAALSSMIRSLAVEFGPRGVRFNVVAPGMTDTLMIADFPEKAKMLAKMQTPLRRLGRPSDVAEAVAFLLGPGGVHITGETLRVCGGAVMV